MGMFHEVVSKDLFSLIPKDEDTKDLHNQRPISFSIVIHQIFTENLQLRLQTLLRVAMSPKQTTLSLSINPYIVI